MLGAVRKGGEKQKRNLDNHLIKNNQVLEGMP
jgi:hypothetical protein